MTKRTNPYAPIERRTSSSPPITSAKNRAVWISILLASIGMLTGAILYVTSADASIADKAAQGDKAVETSVKKHVGENFVDQVKYVKDITTLDERQQQIKKDVGEVKSMIQDIHSSMRQNTNPRQWRQTNREDDD